MSRNSRSYTTVKANTRRDTLELKVLESELKGHLKQVRTLSAMDKKKSHGKSKGDKAYGVQKITTANKLYLQAIKGRNGKWTKN